jgi:IgGFc binding protein
MQRHLLACLPLVCLGYASSCGGHNAGFATDGGGADGTMMGPDTSIMFDIDGAMDSAACTQCSADLHSVLTCGPNPTVVQTCTGGTGCGPGGCIDACMAAAANQSSIGCDYYSIAVDAWNSAYSSGGAAGSCLAAFVTNYWDTPMTVNLVWKGTTINAQPYAYTPVGSGSAITYQPIPTSGIPSNSMAIVFLNYYAAGQGDYHVQCPTGVKVAITSEDTVIHGTALSNAIEIQTSVPAVVYDTYPFGGAASYIASATLLLPVTAWDTNYVGVTMYGTAYGDLYPPGLDLIAQQDGTQITLLPTTAITASGGVPATAANTPVTYTINKGQTVHLMQASGDLTGSIVQSNYPVGVWGEHFCFDQTDETPPWRIVGAVNGTTLTYDPPIAGAPKTLSEGQLVEFDGLPAFEVKSQDSMHPFYLAAHRPGGDCDAGHQQIPPIKALGNDYVAIANESTYYDVGGPETVNVVAPAQYLTSYIFFTDPTFGYTELALDRVKAGDGTFHDITLDCLGKVTGWQPVGSSGTYEYVHIDLRTSDAPVGKCDNGLHSITSDVPFGMTVWGYDSASSYAYPAGASVKPINTVVVPPTPH